MTEMPLTTSQPLSELAPRLGRHAGPVTQTAEWALSARARRVIVLLLGVWILNAFDLGLTVQAQADGVLHEGNPIARALLSWGAGALLAFKATIVLGTSLVLFRYRRRLCAELATAFALVVYALVAVQWKMCYEVYDIASAHTQDAADLVKLYSAAGLIHAGL
jgi:hypothetical protein